LAKVAFESRPVSGRDSIEVDAFILQLGAKTAMRNLLLAISLIMAAPVTVIAGPKEDAYQVVEKFKKAFDASDVQGIVSLFASDAVFLGTVSPKLATKTDEIKAYFQAIKTDTPRTVEIGEYSTLILSDSVVVFAGMDQFSSTRNGKKIDLPARFTLVVTKGAQEWHISHFHSSARPGGG
jgi:uncharacterized protein (TIGR02246 family)